MVSDSVKDGKSIEDHPHRTIARRNYRDEDLSTLVDFEVIEIVDDNNPYPALLGIIWATDVNGVIKLKKQKMIFENKLLCVILPLDLAEGLHYTEPVRDYESDDDLDCIYKIKTRDQDWVNLTVNG